VTLAQSRPFTVERGDSDGEEGSQGFEEEGGEETLTALYFGVTALQ
jgi:hypothetical protein